MKRPILIVIDMLRDFLDAWPPDSRERLVQSTNKLVSLMRGMVTRSSGSDRNSNLICVMPFSR